MPNRKRPSQVPESRSSARNGSTEDTDELRAASTFLIHLGFPDATTQNASRVAELLKLMSAACEIVSPDSETDEQDALQLTAQLGGMAERLGEGSKSG